MNDALLAQFDLVEDQLVEISKTIKREMAENFRDKNIAEAYALYDQLVAVKGLIHGVRNTLREYAPELYPDY